MSGTNFVILNLIGRSKDGQRYERPIAIGYPLNSQHFPSGQFRSLILQQMFTILNVRQTWPIVSLTSRTTAAPFSRGLRSHCARAT